MSNAILCEEPPCWDSHEDASVTGYGPGAWGWSQYPCGHIRSFRPDGQGELWHPPFSTAKQSSSGHSRSEDT